MSNQNKTLYSEIKQLTTIETQRGQAEHIQYVLKPMHEVGAKNTIMIPAITMYLVKEKNERGFDHYNVHRMWNKILLYIDQDILD